MRLLLVGTSHHRAPVELRELVAVPPAAAGAVAARVAGTDGEAVVLSTCNRTELYLVHHDPDAVQERARAELAALSGLPEGELAPALYTLTDQAAALHLFRVTAGLDSMVRGEAQILGQVREAYETAQDAGATGPVLHRLFRHALRAGKRVRSETGMTHNPASVSSAAAELAERVYEAQERRHAATGVATARSDFRLGTDPYYVYNTVLAAGLPWHVLGGDGKHRPSLALVSSGAAVGLWALWRTDYADELIRVVEKLRGGFRHEAQRAKRSGSGRPCQAPRAAPEAG